MSSSWRIAPLSGKKPLARWRLACWLWEREIYNGEKLLGQDQLVFAGHAQQVALPGMLDLDRRSALQQVVARNARALPGGRTGQGRGGRFRLAVHDLGVKREWFALFC